MYLKQIEISGFKSFANRIDLEFTEGITCIVGPNGSGKSNVADAVRWVLGEQSAKQLRGSNMQDVIFSGTQNRRPQGSAYVAITIDNKDRALGMECDEVTVSRRLYRSGESEYRMNGAACRLRDIYELFYDTGIGKEGYSIIGQGQIDQIVSGRPEDRRELLDEAAGIVKFKKRKATTVKKLESEEANLVRVTDILSELEKQVGPLKRQSEKAKEYLRLRDELKVYDVQQFLLESAACEEKIAQTRENAQIIAQDLAGAKETAEQYKARYEELMQASDDLNARIEACHARVTEAGVKKESLEGQILVLQEQIHTEETNDEHYGNRLKNIEEQSAARSKEREELVAQKGEINEQLDEVDDELTEKSDRLEDLDDTIRALEFSLEQGKQGIIDRLNEKADVSRQMERYDSMLEQNASRQSQLSAQLLTLKTSLEGVQAELAQQRKTENDLNVQIEAQDAEGKRAEEAQAAAEKEVRALRERGTQVERQYQAANARYESLRNLAERYEGYGSSVRRVMEVQDKYPGVVGVVADLIETDEKYETAIETALGGAIQNVVTRTEKCAKDLISYLKNNRYGRVTFLPLESIRGSGEFRDRSALSEPGAIGLADSLVRVKAGCEGLAGNLLGRVLVVDTIDHALAIARKYHYSIRMVTLEGELLSAGGSLTGGAFKNNSNLLGRKRELEELEAERKKAKAARENVSDSLVKANTVLEEAKRALADAGETSHALRLSLNTAQLNTEQTLKRLEEMRASFQDFKREYTQLEGAKEQIEKNRKELSEQSDELEERNNDTADKIHVDSGTLESLKSKRDSMYQEQSILKVAFTTLSQRNDFLMENMSRISKELASFREERKQIDEGIRTARSSVADKEKQIEQTRAELEDLQAETESLQTEAASLTEQRDSGAAGQKDFVEKREAALEEVGRLDREAYRLEAQLEKLGEQRETLISYIWTEYELTPVMAREMRRDDEEFGNVAKIRSHAQELKKQIKDLGDVNVGAIEEYKEVSGRYEFLKGQHDDLTQAKESLEQIITELDEGMRRQFTEKFALIQHEFQVVFTELFGGGQGTLSLVEGEDILTAGVQINAQPPGKKLQNMMQLSGGEKALTAICLLFAIQNLKPSPFCLLDEIEAALDDSNVDRFAGYLGNLTDRTQFILISHRRGTMLRADRLYGITMQEKGVSTLVSVDLTDEAVPEGEAKGA